ncbi:unnamed protein product [Oikopleura dioica]|uniref:MYND-type domain-containing protein n=1 Tax=Oikopleura dioica TaxID=34765 RepID=E4YHZ5_OIKDI|nr:unnamed protein product [Oikopleura dioica]
MGEERSGTSEVEVEDTDDDNVFNSSTQSEVLSAKSLKIASTPSEPAKSSSDSSNASSAGSSNAALSKSEVVVNSQSMPIITKTSPLVTHLITPSSQLPHSATLRSTSLESIARYTATTPQYRTIVPNPGHRPLTPYQLALGHRYNRSPWIIDDARNLPYRSLDENRIDNLIEDARKTNPLQVYCNAPGGTKICGKLYKEKFANGTKGKCIEFENRMLTPFEFEKACNLGNSRDWRRSIHFSGDHIKVLIKCKILLVHAQSCNCAICSPETGASKPKYEIESRRKRSKDGNLSAIENTPKRAHLIHSRLDPRLSRHFFPDPTPRPHTYSIYQININFENPSDPARIPSELPNELELLEAALELNRQKRDQFFVDYESTVGELEGQITTLQEKLKTIKNSLSDRFKEINSETDRLTVNLLAYCQTKRRHGESPETERNEQPEPRSAPAEFQDRRKQNFYDKRRTNSDTSMMRSSQISCSNRNCLKKAEWRCRGCSKAYYCSKMCQEYHWMYGHDSECDSDD